MRHVLFAVLAVSAASGCASESMSDGPETGAPAQGGAPRRIAWTDNGKSYHDEALGISRAIVTNVSTVDFILATGGSLDASILFSVTAEHALTTGTYRCADEDGSSLRYASMSYSLDQPLAALEDCTFTITQVSSTSGAVVAGTFSATARFDVVHDLSGRFSAPVQIMYAQ